MKAQIENKPGERDEQLTGFFKFLRTPQKISFYQVSLHLEFSEEERAILTQYKLWGTVVYSDTFTSAPDSLAAYSGLESLQGDPVHYRIKHIAGENGFHKSFKTPVEAENFVNKLKTEILPNIKKYIDQSRESGPGTKTTFEL